MIGTRTLARVGAVTAFAIACTSLAGWLLGVEWLKTLSPGVATMKANTAIAACALALAVWLVTSGRLPRLAAGLGIAVAALSGATLLQYAVGLDLRIDEALVSDDGPLVGSVAAGRMASNTAAALLLLGVAIALRTTTARRAGQVGDALAVAAGLLSAVALVGYTSDARALYAVWDATEMPVRASLSLTVLAVAVLLTSRTFTVTRLLESKTLGGSVTRRLLPAVLILPAVVGWLARTGEEAGVFGAPVGRWLLAIVLVAVPAALVIRLALALERVDRERLRVDDQLRQRNAELDAFAYSASHDLRAPLVSIEGFAASLQRCYGDALDERGREYVVRIRANAVALQRLVHEMLDYARVGADEKLAPVDAHQLASEVVATMNARGEQRVELVAALPPLRAHPVRFRQALTNLVENALAPGRLRHRARARQEDRRDERRIRPLRGAAHRRRPVRPDLSQGGRMTTHTILLAEDNPDHALLAREALEAVHGDSVEIHVVRDGLEALEYLFGSGDVPPPPPPHLILLDIQMPGATGFEVLERVKADEKLRVIPVVMLTSSDDERDIARSYGLGTNSYVTKPIEADALYDRISRIPSYWFRVNSLPALETPER